MITDEFRRGRLGAAQAYTAASPEDVAQIMDGDPGVRAGIFSYEIHPVRGFPGSSLPG